MSWAVGYDPNWKRDVGYGVPSICDHPDCTAEIHRGLAYVCGDDIYGGTYGCGLHFCENHLGYAWAPEGDDLLKVEGKELPRMCERCVINHQNPDAQPEYFTPKPDVREWIEWKLTDDSWRPWRDENPGEVKQLQDSLGGGAR